MLQSPQQVNKKDTHSRCVEEDNQRLQRPLLSTVPRNRSFTAWGWGAEKNIFFGEDSWGFLVFVEKLYRSSKSIELRPQRQENSMIRPSSLPFRVPGLAGGPAGTSEGETPSAFFWVWLGELLESCLDLLHYERPRLTNGPWIWSKETEGEKWQNS